MVSVPYFEWRVTQSDICLLSGGCSDFSLVDNVFVVAISVHGAGVWIAIITIFVIIILLRFA